MLRISALAALLVGSTLSASAHSVVYQLAPCKQTRSAVVASVEVPPYLEGKPMVLVPVAGGQALPVQLDATGKRGLCLLPGPIAPGQTPQFRLAQPAAESAPTVVAEDDGQRVVLKVGGKQVLTYNQALVPAPKPDESYYARSGYLHPVFAPSGQQVTDDFNPDHAHQHGIMFAWRKLTFEGRESNGWDQKLGLGKVEHVKLDSSVSGPVFGGFAARLRQLDLTAPGGAKPVLNEQWTVRVYNLADPFVFDLEMVQTCASQVPVQIDKIHYGGLMIRGRADWAKTKDLSQNRRGPTARPNGPEQPAGPGTGSKTYEYLTSEGKTRADGDQPQARWCDIFGPVGDGSVGAAILSHPANFHAPQPVRLHPKMPYFCFTPATAGEFTIQPGRPYVSRYRFVIHDGPADAARLEAFWQAFAQPAELHPVTAAN